MNKQGSVKLLLFLPLLFHSALHADTSAISPLPVPKPVESAKYLLGKRLFEDPLFSSNQTLSCNSCHSLQKAGIDGLPRYIGLNKIQGTLNTPTVLNSKFNFRQFWDGRATDFCAVINDHVSDTTVFSNSWDVIIKRIKEDKEYTSSIKREYRNEDPNPDNVRHALNVFLDNLITPHSPFDKYLSGDDTAISDDAKKGYELFQQYGCDTCHEGPNMGGNLFQKLGIYKDYYSSRGTVKSDFGMYNITKNDTDKYVFKVPSLRNIALTAPYLHDGSVATLEEMVEIMGIYQVGQPIPKFEIDYIVKFLQSLNGLQSPE